MRANSRCGRTAFGTGSFGIVQDNMIDCSGAVKVKRNLEASMCGRLEVNPTSQRSKSIPAWCHGTSWRIPELVYCVALGRQ